MHSLSFKNLMAWFTGLFASLILLTANQAFAASNPAEELEKLLNNITSLSIKFEQITQDGRGLKLQQSSGEAHLAKPQLFYWHTQEPYEQLIVSNGKLMWVYEPDLEQVTQQELTNQLGQSPVFLLISQVESLDRHFKIQLQTLGNKQIFTLKPLTSDSLFEELKLSFVNSQISSLQLIDSLGQKTLIDLLIEANNPKLNPEIFNFTPPKGVDLIQQAN